MKLNGNDFVKKIADRLTATGVRAYDSHIVRELKQMSKIDMYLLITMGDIPKWHNQEIEQAKEPK